MKPRLKSLGRGGSSIPKAVSGTVLVSANAFDGSRRLSRLALLGLCRRAEPFLLEVGDNRFSLPVMLGFDFCCEFMEFLVASICKEEGMGVAEPESDALPGSTLRY
jgi:hypothetical protein